MRWPLLWGSLFGALAVMLGAFGAHALRDVLDERALVVWHTAVDYQFWHALALLAVGLLVRERATRSLQVAGFGFVLGVPLFCGSLYALALGAPHAIGVVTPLGGVAFIVGWLALAWSARRATR
jgi:uncharacterized membrane protein YgdD (TMEM256/DUF423 family)